MRRSLAVHRLKDEMEKRTMRIVSASGDAKVRELMRDSGPRVSAVRTPADVRVFEVASGAERPSVRGLDEIGCARPFRPHPGWAGQIELASERVPS